MSQVTIDSKISANNRSGKLLTLLQEIEDKPEAINFSEPVPYL